MTIGRTGVEYREAQIESIYDDVGPVFILYVVQRMLSCSALNTKNKGAKNALTSWARKTAILADSIQEEIDGGF